MKAFGKKPKTWEEYADHFDYSQESKLDYKDYRTEHFRLALLEAANAWQEVHDATVHQAIQDWPKFRKKYNIPKKDDLSKWLIAQLRLSAGCDEK